MITDMCQIKKKFQDIEDEVFCTTCGWEGTHHELIDDNEVDDETEDWVQCCPKCTSSYVSMYVEQ